MTCCPSLVEDYFWIIKHYRDIPGHVRVSWLIKCLKVDSLGVNILCEGLCCRACLKQLQLHLRENGNTWTNYNHLWPVSLNNLASYFFPKSLISEMFGSVANVQNDTRVND